MKISAIAGTIMFGFATLFKIQHWPYAGAMMVLGAFILAFVFMPSALVVLWKESHNRNRLFLFISGFLTGMLFIIGTLFKIQHWPEAGIILTLSVFCAIFFFIPSLLLNRLADPVKKPKRKVYILGAAGAILYIAGTLFKIQHWPLAALFMVLSLIILFILVLPWYSWLTWKDESHISASFIFIIIGSLLIIVPGALINLNLRNMYNNGYYLHLTQEQNLTVVSLTINKSLLTQFHDSACYNQMEPLHNKTMETLDYLAKVQKQMVEDSDGKPENPALNTEAAGQTENGTGISFSNLSSPFDLRPARDFLMPGSSVRQKLNNMLADYMNYVVSLTPEKDPGKFSGLLDPSVYLPAGPQQSDLTLMSALHTLEIMKNNIIAVESHMLTLLINR